MQEKHELHEMFRLDGNERFKKGDYEGALALYTESLSNTKTVASLANRAQTYIMLKRFEEAIDDCESAIKMESNNYKAHGRKAIASHALGCFEIAMKEFLWCLEIDPMNKRFQQLFNECQKAVDSKNYVNMKMVISFYNDSEKEMELSLVKGLPFHFTHPMKRFKELDSLKTYLTEHISASLGSILLNNVTIDEPLMQFFRSLNPVILRSSNLDYFNVNCSKAHFDELFGGNMFAPMSIWFYQHDNAPYENNFLPAINSRKLAAIRDAKSFILSLTRPDLSKMGVPFTGQQQPDIDSLLDFVHTEYPGLPAHVRRSTIFCQCPKNTTRLEMSVNEAIEMMRSFSGRMLRIDLRYLGLRKLPELIDKCKQRFFAANHSIAYSIDVRFKLAQTDRNDAISLFPIVEQQNGRLILQNALGEKLQLSIIPDFYCTQGQGQSQAESASVLHIERVLSNGGGGHQ